MMPDRVRRAHVSCDPSSLKLSNNVSHAHHINVILPLKGTYDGWLGDRVGDRHIKLYERDLLLRAPGTWIAADPAGEYRSIGFLFSDQLTVVYGIHAVPGSPSRQDVQFVHWLHENLPSPLPQIGRLTCEAMYAAAKLPPDDPTLIGLANALLAQMRWLLQRVAPMSQQPGKALHTFESLTTYIRANANQPLSRESVAEALRLTPRHISRLFSEYSQETFNDFLYRVRLEQAAVLTANPSLSLSEIAYLCGFSSAALFCRRFKSRYGVTPTEYRAQ